MTEQQFLVNGGEQQNLAIDKLPQTERKMSHDVVPKNFGNSTPQNLTPSGKQEGQFGKSKMAINTGGLNSSTKK